MEFSTPTCLGPMTNSVENRSQPAAFSITYYATPHVDKLWYVEILSFSEFLDKKP